MMKTVRISFALLLLCFFLQSFAIETVRFDITLFGDKIGVMTATRELKPDGTEFYVLESSSKAKILWIDKSNTTRYEVTYKNGRLLTATFKETDNGKLKRWTNVQWDGAKYQVDSYKGKRSFTEVPDYSIVTMYFHDITNRKRIFYEAEGDFSNLEHPEPNTWEFKSSDGNRNIYHFANNQIKDMEFRVSIATVKMVRTN